MSAQLEHKVAEPVDPLLARCEAVAFLGTGPISDAMELLGLPRRVILGMELVSADQGRSVVGPAYTLRQASKARATPHDVDLTRQRVASSKLAAAGDVIVIDSGGRLDMGTWGENQAMMAQSRGIVGLVVHGAVRDKEWIRRTGFPVLCRGFSPVSSKWELETVSMNERVVIDGVPIEPGDIIYGDADGCIVIARADCDRVFDKALEIHRLEEEKRAALHGHGRQGFSQGPASSGLA